MTPKSSDAKWHAARCVIKWGEMGYWNRLPANLRDSLALSLLGAYDWLKGDICPLCGGASVDHTEIGACPE